MKTSTINAVIIFVTAVLLQSCASAYYYQVYDVETEGMQCEKNVVLFSNGDCDIVYDLWGEAGNLGFFFRNNTDEDIFIDLSRSFFIRNGIAYDYFVDAEYTQSVTAMSGASASLSASYTQLWYELPMWTPTVVTRGAQVTANGSVGTTSSITTRESRYICVPAKSAKFIAGFNISDYVYNNGEDSKLDWPKRESRRVVYSKDESPLVFRNKICYFVGESEEGTSIDNSFWVSGFTNYNGREFYVENIKSDCLDSSITKKVKTHKYRSATKFFNEYKINKPEQPFPFY